MKKREHGQCDFCSSPDVRWAYPARDFVVDAETVARNVGAPELAGLIPDWGSRGGWAACPACHALVQRGDRDRLAIRSAKRMRRVYASLSMREALTAVRRVQDDFWANREGAPEPIELT
jgi:hypothetical protein